MFSYFEPNTHNADNMQTGIFFFEIVYLYLSRKLDYIEVKHHRNYDKRNEMLSIMGSIHVQDLLCEAEFTWHQLC